MADINIVADMAIPVIIGGATLLAMSNLRSSDVATRSRSCVQEILAMKSGTIDGDRVQNLLQQIDKFNLRYKIIAISGVFFLISIASSLLFDATIVIAHPPFA